MDNRPFSSLPEPKTQSSGRYEVTAGRPVMLTNVERKVSYPLESHLDQEALLENLAHDLAKISNYRVGRYDALLNSVEAWTRVYYFIIDSFPEMLTAGALQPLVDLDACLHDLTVNNFPGLVYNRARWMDGGYRTLEEILEVIARGEKPRKRSNRSVRSYRDRQEGRLVLALDALKLAYPGASKQQKAAITPILKGLLKQFGIRTIDDLNGELTTAEEVWKLARTAGEKGRSGGRRYAYERVKKQFETELQACVSRECALQFAREQLEWVRCRQPINRPLPPGQKRKSKPKLVNEPKQHNAEAEAQL